MKNIFKSMVMLLVITTFACQKTDEAIEVEGKNASTENYLSSLRTENYDAIFKHYLHLSKGQETGKTVNTNEVHAHLNLLANVFSCKHSAPISKTILRVKPLIGGPVNAIRTTQDLYVFASDMVKKVQKEKEGFSKFEKLGSIKIEIENGIAKYVLQVVGLETGKTKNDVTPNELDLKLKKYDLVSGQLSTTISGLEYGCWRSTDNPESEGVSSEDVIESEIGNFFFETFKTPCFGSYSPLVYGNGAVRASNPEDLTNYLQGIFPVVLDPSQSNAHSCFKFEDRNMFLETLENKLVYGNFAPIASNDSWSYSVQFVYDQMATEPGYGLGIICTLQINYCNEETLIPLS